LKIDEKYQVWQFELGTGKMVTGMILSDNGSAYKVVENPLASASAVELKKADIVNRDKVASSLMPKGLLDKLTKDEILDLIAYVAAYGDPKHKLYSGGAGAGHDHAPGGHQH